MPKREPRVAGKITKFTKKEIFDTFKNTKTLCSNLGLVLKASKINTNFNNIGKILIILPKKVGSAPIRNKIRRRIKHIFYDQKIYKYNFNFIIYCKKDITTFSYSYLQDLLLNCINQVT